MISPPKSISLDDSPRRWRRQTRHVQAGPGDRIGRRRDGLPDPVPRVVFCHGVLRVSPNDDVIKIELLSDTNIAIKRYVHNIA